MTIQPWRLGDSDRVLRGKIVAAFVKRGWRPPPLNDFQAQRLIEDIGDLPTSHGHTHSTLELTERETLVLQLAADGRHVQDSATELGVGRETIKSQTRAVRSKLGANTIAHAVAIGFRKGLIA